MKKHFIWLLIILAIQTSTLYGINKYFYVEEVVVAAPLPAPVTPDEEPEEDKGEVRLVGTSFDRQFYAVAYNKKLEIYRPKEAKAVFDIDVPDGMYVSVMHWLPDENRLLYALANFSKARYGRVEVHVVDMARGKNTLVKDINKLSKGSHVADFALSTITNLLYLDVENKSKNDSIYQIDIMKRMQRINLPSTKIGKIALAKKEDLLFYDDKTRRQVFSYNGKKVKMITPDDWDYCLLGITKDDQLYIGRLDDGKVTSIYKSDKYGEMELFADLSRDIPIENIMMGLNDQIVLKEFPADKYIAVIKPDGRAKTYNRMDPNAIVTGDAIFSIQDGLMHITYLD